MMLCLTWLCLKNISHDYNDPEQRWRLKTKVPSSSPPTPYVRIKTRLLCPIRHAAQIVKPTPKLLIYSAALQLFKSLRGDVVANPLNQPSLRVSFTHAGLSPEFKKRGCCKFTLRVRF